MLNRNMNVECEAYGKLEDSVKIDMNTCSAYGILQTLQNAVDSIICASIAP